jgi:hypothetical protein
MSRVSTVPNENSHKVVDFVADSSNTNSGGKSIQPWQPKHKTHKTHWGTFEKEVAGQQKGRKRNPTRIQQFKEDLI